MIRMPKAAKEISRMNQATKKPNLPVCVFCRNCGAPAGYDIIRQTYHCAYCGEDTGITEARHQLAGRRSLKKTPYRMFPRVKSSAVQTAAEK